MTSRKIRSEMLPRSNSSRSKKRIAHGVSPKTHETKRGEKEHELDLTRA